MITFACRGCGVSQHLKAVSQSVGGRYVSKPLPSLLYGNTISQRTLQEHEHDHSHDWPEMIPYNEETIRFAHHLVPPAKTYLTNYSLEKTLIRRQLLFGSGISVGYQMRYAHTDIKVPDFSAYRRPSTSDPTKRNDASVDSRRVFTYMFTAGFGVGSVIIAKEMVHACVNILAPAKDALALDKIEVDIGKIPEGKNVTVKWRGKPVFIRHRTADEIARERAVNIKDLRDPQKDEDRSQTGEWLIVVGICTHLGCVPIPNQGDFGGYYCPCHGSHYDASGRIRKGPAPLNLEVPDYTIEGTLLVVG